MPPRSRRDGDPPLAMQAWGALLAAHAALTRSMDQTLRERTGMSLQWYDALAQIAAAGRSTTMRELERRVLLSQSGVSRLVSRLQDAGLVTRDATPHDRRSVELTLTAHGRNRLRAARKVQAEQVRTQFADRMSESEATVVLGVLRRFHRASQDHCGAPSDRNGRRRASMQPDPGAPWPPRG